MGVHEDVEQSCDLCSGIISFYIHRRISLYESSAAAPCHYIVIFRAFSHLLEDKVGGAVQYAGDLCDARQFQSLFCKVEDRSPIHHRSLVEKPTSLLSCLFFEICEFPCDRPLVCSYDILASFKGRLYMRYGRLSRKYIQRSHLYKHIVIRLLGYLKSRQLR